VEMIEAIGRVPVERSTDYRQRRRIDSDASPIGPRLGPQADGTPLVESATDAPAGEAPTEADD
ncbi:MAG: 7,8-didemethyl-8-hydroxy-5-deazariboflavin synthase subunit CofH, partial [Haloarculaceae archaeon]